MVLFRRLAAAVLLCAGLGLYAQEGDGEGESPITSDWSGFVPNVYTRGDQTFNIGMSLIIPLFYAMEGRGMLETNLKLGWGISLGYNFFLGSHFFVGGELKGAFFGTVGKNNYFIVPLGVHAGWQFILWRFEFPLSLMAGMAPQQRLGDSYLGFFMKPAAGVYFRFNSEWSFGTQLAFWWVPQWTNKSRPPNPGKVNIHGFFLEVALGARYHF